MKFDFFSAKNILLKQWRPGIDLVVCDLEYHVIGLKTVSLGHIYPYPRSPYEDDNKIEKLFLF